MKVFLASAIDEDESRGMHVREVFGKLIEECGCEVTGAGIADNPIIDVDSSKADCQNIIVGDLLEQSQARVTLVVAERTFAVGTWIEAWEAYRMHQYLIVFVWGGAIRSIFLRGIADEIIYNDLEELRSSIKRLKERYG